MHNTSSPFVVAAAGISGGDNTGGMRYAFTHPKTSGGILYVIAGK